MTTDDMIDDETTDHEPTGEDTGEATIDELLDAYLDTLQARADDDLIDIDVPLPEIGDDSLEGTRRPKIEDLDELGLLNDVVKHGSRPVDQDTGLIKCHGYKGPAYCGVMMLPHPATGDSIPICHGPSVRFARQFSLLKLGMKESYISDRPHHSCPFHPKRLNEPPTYLPDPPQTKGWLSDQ